MAYTPTGTFNDAALSEIDKKKVDALSQQWKNAQAAGATKEALDGIHSQAEQIRGGYGYGGGADGTEYNIVEKNVTTSPEPSKATIQAPTAQDEYINAMYKAQRENALKALEGAYRQNVIDIDAQAAKIPAMYQGARNQTAATAEQERAAFNEYAAGSGLNSGAGGQADLAMRNQNASNMSAINQQEANAKNEFETARLKLQTQYQSDIAQAIAQGDLQKAQALYQEAVRVDEGMVAQSKAQADENYRYWAAQQEQQQQQYAIQKQKADTLAAYGDFSGYSALGYTPQQIAQMQDLWAKKNPLIAASGGGGYTPTAPDDEDINFGPDPAAQGTNEMSPYDIMTDIGGLKQQGFTASQIVANAKAAHAAQQITDAQYQMYVQYAGRD